MATTTKTLYRGAAATSSTTVYTVPSATIAVITNIGITNTTASTATYSISFNGTIFADTVSISAKDTVLVDLKQVLNATNVIAASASTTAVNFHISGVEIA